MFPDNMDRQKDKLVRMLSFIVKALDWGADEWAVEVDPEDDLFMVVLAMGRRHGNLYRIPDSSYPVVGEALLWTLDQGLGDAFTPELKEAWTKLYGTLACKGDDTADRPHRMSRILSRPDESQQKGGDA